MTSTTHWTEAPLSAVALIKASITNDDEAQEVLARYADNRVHEWLVIFARSWLLAAAGIRDIPAEEVVDNAISYLDGLTASWRDAA